ncbi:Tyrosine recombinase XerD [Sulfurospirillum diekertiae]|uniref:Tyrosine recombinase XerD n=1 Tax=Sulfurospirillum diekertiae TaxID=1854492 RepID=A0A1Y0HL88_9BACT|nr:Tyrosine recombinase XerD [Sulfurospirillum diekertiae]
MTEKNRVVIHTLRHTFASQLISNNAPIFTVKKLMHHADIKTTMRYVSVDNNFGQNFVDNIF